MENTKNTSTQNVSFLKALFDFKFDQFIYIRVARVVYAALVILILIAAAAMTLIALAGLSRAYYDSERTLAIGIALASPVVALVSIIVLRLTFESGIALVDIAENTRKK
jgi:hypothetical protein